MKGHGMREGGMEGGRERRVDMIDGGKGGMWVFDVLDFIKFN